MQIENELLTILQVCKLAQVSKSWVYDKIESGDLPHVTLPGGRLIRIPASALRTRLGLASGGIQEKGEIGDNFPQ